MKDSVSSGVAVLLAIVGVAAIAIVVSSQSQSISVFGSFGTAFVNAIKCAVAPVTGGSCPGNAQIPVVTSTITFGS